jgi:microcystin-dependent protein
VSQYAKRSDSGTTLYGLPTNPVAGTIAIDTDGFLKKYNGIVWSIVGAGQDVDAINYLDLESASLADFTQVGLVLSASNPLKSSISALLTSNISTTQSFKKVIPIDREFRGKNSTLTLQVRSSATQGNITILVYDETNATNLVASQPITLGSISIPVTTTSASNSLSSLSSSDINKLKVGMSITGAGILANTVINAINSSTNTVTISNNASASATVALRVSDLPQSQSFSFDIPASCSSISYTISALVEINSPESYFDDISVKTTSTVLMSTSASFVQAQPTIQKFLSGSGTYTTPANASYIKIRMVGGGGNGGASALSVSSSGGGAGGYVEKIISLPSPTYSYVVGGIASTSTFIGVGINLSAGGGSVGLTPAVSAGTVGGAGGAVSGGDLDIPGERGGSSFGYVNPDFFPGAGGSGTFGSGGYAGGTNVGQGGGGIGYGSGGGGSANGSGGGPGAAGYIEVTEYYTIPSVTIPLTTAQLIQTPDSGFILDSFLGYGSTATRTCRFSTIRQNIGSAVQYISDSTLGDKIVVLQEGLYNCSMSWSANAASDYGLSKNASSLTVTYNALAESEKITGGTTSTVGFMDSSSAEVYLYVGDVIRAHSDGGASSSRVSRIVISFKGSLKQLNPSSNTNITIPTHSLRFEGASTRGSVDTAIVKFDTQTITQGDAWDVVNTLANGTVITMKKAGKLSVSFNVYASTANNEFCIGLNQSNTLTNIASSASEKIASGYSQVAGVLSMSGTVDVKIGDKVRVCAAAAVWSSNPLNNFLLSLTETSIPANFSNVLPQWSQTDSSVSINTLGTGAAAYGSTNTAIYRFANNDTNLGSDITYSDSSTLGASFVANSNGIYSTNWSGVFDTVADIGISKNSVNLTTDINAIPVTERLAVAINATAWIAPTVQKFLSGSGTYTTPANVSYIRVRMVGGGGGGGGSSSASNAGTGTSGNASAFGTLQAVGGGGGNSPSSAGVGGTAGFGVLNGNTGSIFYGGMGGTAATYVASGYATSGTGGNTLFGGTISGSINGAGTNGTVNTGTGGAGASCGAAAAQAGNGGGGAGSVDVIISNPSATYSYTVGTGGASGAAGTNGSYGGVGGSGYIEITEYTSTGADMSASWTGYLSKGDVIRPHGGVANSITVKNARNKFTMSKVGKPNVASVDVTPFVNLKLPDTNIVGEVVAYAGSNIPTNFLNCDGSAVSRTLYADLFNVISTSHGVGDGSTTFNIPDYRGRALRGVDGGTGRDSFTRTAMNTGGNTSGVGSVQTDATKKNGLAVVDPGHSHTVDVWFSEVGTGPNQSHIQGYGGSGPYSVGATISSSSNTSLNAGDAETVMKNAAVKYIIRYMPNQTGIAIPTTQVSSDTINFIFKATAIDPAVDVVGTFNTYTIGISSNTPVLATSAPTQSLASINANGFQLFSKAFNIASTAASPARVDFFIGKGLKSKQVDAYANISKILPVSFDYYANGAIISGIRVSYSEITGILQLDAALDQSGASTTRWIGMEATTPSNPTSGYFVFNASKSPSLVTIPTNVIIPNVSALYVGVPTGTIAGSYNLATISGKIKDTHNAYVSGVYTIPESGTYSISASLSINGTFALNNQAYVDIGIDGGNNYQGATISGGSQNVMFPQISVNSIPLLAGQTVRINSYANGSAMSYTAVGSLQRFSITRTGNY